MADEYDFPSYPASFGQVLLAWEAPEHEPFELGPKTRLIGTLLLVGIVAYALVTNSPLMAITFILIGILIYLLQHQPPRILWFAFTTRGIAVGNQFYPYENIASYHIYEDPPFEDLLSLHIGGTLFSHAHVQLLNVSQDEVHDILSRFLPEETHEPHFIDMIDKFLHI